MTTSAAASRSAITFAHRRYEGVAHYRWWQRLIDHIQGRRDGRTLSASQAIEVEPGAEAPSVLLTPWAQRLLAATREAERHEAITLQRIIDAAQVELASMSHEEPPSSPSGGSRSVGEDLESPDERRARRARQEAEETARRAAQDRRRRTLTETIASAHQSYVYRVDALRNAATRRLATYTRGMQRTAPSCALVHRLCEGPDGWGSVVPTPEVTARRTADTLSTH